MATQLTATPCPAWCRGHDGPIPCDFGVDPHTGRAMTYHGTDGLKFTFTNADGERTFSGYVDVARTDFGTDAGRVGVLVCVEQWSVKGAEEMTPAQARQLAAALLNAADRADSIEAARA